MDVPMVSYMILEMFVTALGSCRYHISVYRPSFRWKLCILIIGHSVRSDRLFGASSQNNVCIDALKAKPDVDEPVLSV